MRLVALPVAGRAADAPVDDEVLRALRHLRVQVVHEHAEGRFLLPGAARERRSPRCANDARGLRGRRHISHRWPSVVSSLARSKSWPRPRRPGPPAACRGPRGRRGPGCRLRQPSIPARASRRKAARPDAVGPGARAEREAAAARRSPRPATGRSRPGATELGGSLVKKAHGSPRVTPAYRKPRPPRRRGRPRSDELRRELDVGGEEAVAVVGGDALAEPPVGGLESGRGGEGPPELQGLAVAASASTARIRAVLATTRAALRAAVAPMDTWSSLLADVGMESTLAGWARTLFSEARAAAVTCASMSPDSTPPFAGEEGGQVRERGVHEPLDAALADRPDLRQARSP